MRLLEILFSNWQLKLLSLIFATVLWLFVMLETADETEVPLKVKFINTPPGLTLQGSQVNQCSLRIIGPRTLLIRQGWKGAEIELDLSGAQAGSVTFSGLDRYPLLIPGVRSLRVSPANLEIYLTRE